jgi:hypothetical protein
LGACDQPHRELVAVGVGTCRKSKGKATKQKVGIGISAAYI